MHTQVSSVTYHQRFALTDYRLIKFVRYATKFLSAEIKSVIMDRRNYLSTLLLSTVLPGCLANSQNAQPEPEATENPDPSEDIFIFISNERNEQIMASLTVMNSGGSVIAEENTTIEPGETVEVYTGITETGVYPYAFFVNGQQQFEKPYNIDEYRLENGLDVNISVMENGIEVSAED